MLCDDANTTWQIIFAVFKKKKKKILLCLCAADGTVPGGLGDSGRGEHGHPRLPA